VPETEAQAAALKASLADLGEIEIIIAMRYWHPMSDEAAKRVAAFQPDQIVLLPLYPQFSTTTTASSVGAWNKSAGAAGITATTRTLCCYPREPGLIEAQCSLIAPALDEAAAHGTPRLLLSAHGLPKKIVAAGDPYQWQVEETAKQIVARLDRSGLDWTVCYQSRVGPLAWIGPSTDDEIARAGSAGVPLVVAPIAFVSEHSETLVELDIEYRKLADDAGVPRYIRVPAIGTHPAFIGALADLVRRTMAGDYLCSGEAGRLCPTAHSGCAFTTAGR
jgi:ferrochelatase